MTSCLVAIDVQAGFISPRTQQVPDRIVKLAQSQLFDYVAATRFMNYPGSPYEKFIGWTGLSDPKSQAVYPRLEACVDRVFNKTTYTCFTDEFVAFITDNNIDELYFVGIDTDCCVMKSALDSFERLISCHVLTYYCASNGGPTSHEAAITVLRRNIGASQLIDGPISSLPSCS